MKMHSSVLDTQLYSLLQIVPTEQKKKSKEWGLHLAYFCEASRTLTDVKETSHMYSCEQAVLLWYVFENLPVTDQKCTLKP